MSTAPLPLAVMKDKEINVRTKGILIAILLIAALLSMQTSAFAWDLDYSGPINSFTGDPIEETTITVTAGEETLISGVIRESDRAFVAETAPEAMTFAQLCGATLESNYNISDAYIIVYNARGQEIYKHAVRATSCLMNMTMAATGNRVFTWGEVESGETYRAELVVQLLTGERPTVWSGELTF